MQKIQKTMFLVAAFSMWISTGVQAADITVPHTFSSGTTIKSSEFNENFSTIYQKYNELATRVAALETGSSTCTSPDSYPPGFCNNGNGTVTNAETGLILLANADGTVTNAETGLILLANADCFGTLNWDSAMSAAATLADGQCGLTDGSAAGDWRLPTTSTQSGGMLSDIDDAGELEVLYDAKASPLFSSVQAIDVGLHTNYWSSTTSPHGPSHAYTVTLSYGHIGGSRKTNTRYVWPVRGGQ